MHEDPVPYYRLSLHTGPLATILSASDLAQQF